MTPGARRTLLLAFGALAAGAILALILSNVVTLDQFKARREQIQAVISSDPVRYTALFIAIFAVCAALAPGAMVFKMIAGALFGLWAGAAVAVTATVSASVIGFVLARYFLRRRFERRWEDRLAMVNRGVEQDGILFLLAMRFNPLVPFFLINFGMGLTRMRLWVFTLTSLFGVMPASFVYTNAGTQLAQIESPSDILSVRLLGSLLLLSLMPLAGRWLALHLRRRRDIAVGPGCD